MTSDPRQTAGFTLIELLVVVSILAILTLGAVLGAGGAFGIARDGAASRFAQAMNAARDRAVLGRQVIGVRPRQDGWLIVARAAEAGDAGWDPVAPGVSGIAIRWRLAGAPHQPAPAPERTDPPPIRLFPGGHGTAFGADFAASGRVIRCASDGWTPVVCR